MQKKTKVVIGAIFFLWFVQLGTARAAIVPALPVRPPTAIRAEQVQKNVQVSWTLSGEKGVTGYVVYRSEKRNTRGPVFVRLTKIARSYTDKRVLPQHTYFYTVHAVRGKSESKNTDSVSVAVKKNIAAVKPTTVVRPTAPTALPERQVSGPVERILIPRSTRPDETMPTPVVIAPDNRGEIPLVLAQSMTFFVTSGGNSPHGGNYGSGTPGFSGPDAFCQRFAANATAPGAREKQWVAYVSTANPIGHAKDHIGSGPWFNFLGKQITRDDLTRGIPYADILDEKGGTVEQRNEHDIVTGSNRDGTLAVRDGNAQTCGDWAVGTDDAATVVGHANWDIVDASAQSFNSQHTVSCSQESFRQSAGIGRLYCFAK